MDLYAENILDHSKHPRHVGSMPNATYVHTEKNASCGDSLTVYLRIHEDGFLQCSWTGSGCAISQASMSMLSELLNDGYTREQVLELTSDDLLKMLGVPIGPSRLPCALLSLDAVKKAVVMKNDIDEKKGM